MRRILCLAVKKEQVLSSQSTASASALTVTAQSSRTLVKRLRLEGKQLSESHKGPATFPSSSLPMDLSDAPACVRLNMKRSPLERHSERPKQRRVLANPDGDDGMIVEIQVNEDVDHPWSEVSATEFDDWQHEDFAGKLKDLE